MNMLTFFLFPGCFLRAHYNSLDDLRLDDFTWYSLIVISIFNLVDSTGRKLAVVFKMPVTGVFILGFLRIAFVFTIIVMATFDTTHASFEQDWIRIMNLALFAFTNGYVQTSVAFRVPTFVPEAQREQIGKFVGLFMGIGTLLGTGLAVPLGAELSEHKTFYTLRIYKNN